MSSSERMPFRPMIGSEKSIFVRLVLEEVERSIIFSNDVMPIPNDVDTIACSIKG
jgi:hypothetical protein